MDPLRRACLAELIGTFAVVFVGAVTVCTTHLIVPGPVQAQSNLVAIALAEGFILAAALSATLPISGGYLNPAVTLTLWVFRRLTGRQALGFIIAQVIGALIAGFFVKLLFVETILREAHCGAPHINTESFMPTGQRTYLHTIITGIGIEVALTFLLTFAIFGTTIDPRAPRLGGLGVGLTMTAVVLMAFPLTGAAANPVRWFGPALWEATLPGTEAFRDHSVYWIGPIAGALLAGTLYEWVILPAARAKPEGDRPLTEGGAVASATQVKAKK